MLVALDFDGTLAPIVQRAGDAALPAETRRALEQLNARADTDVAVLSGRALEDVARRVGLAGILFAGNHGLEIRGPGVARVHEDARAARPKLDAVVRTLAHALEGVPGAWTEDKGLTLSIHDRETPEADRERVRAAVLAAVAPHEGLRVTHGKRVMEVRPDVPWDKGRAILWLIEALGVPSDAPVLYAGDDATDEDAFRALGQSGISIRVGAAGEPTAARWRLPSVEAVGALLRALARE